MNIKIIPKIKIIFFFVFASSLHLQASCPVLSQAPGSPYDGGFSQGSRITYSPDGRYLALLGSFNSILVYSVDSNTGALTFSSQPTGVAGGAIAYSPNGKFSATTNSIFLTTFTVNSTTGVWTETSDGATGFSGQFALAFSANSMFAAIGTETSGQQLVVYSVNQTNGVFTNPITYNIGASVFSVTSIAYSPNGKFLAATTGSSVYLFTVNNSTGVLTPIAGSPITPTDGAGTVVYSPDSKFAAVTSPNTPGSVSVYAVDPTTGFFNNTVPGSPFAVGSESVQSIAYSPEGNFAVVGLEGELVNVYNVDTATGIFTSLLGSITSGSPYPVVAFGTNNNSFAVSNSLNSTILVINIFDQQAQLNSAAIDDYGRVSAFGYGAQAGSVVQLYANCTIPLGTTTADSFGNFSIVASKLLPTNIYRITAVQSVNSCLVYSNSILVGATMLSPFIQRVLEKYNNGC
jgi:WD40 repeat protein